ncbi:MAG: hydrolase or metal-binding protein [Pseudomonadales bacterium]|nr:hydrolase or metal-binding protein [Pseudomonadales bacterium]
MIKGLALTPPVIGRISIGRVVEKNGKRLPEKDDQFTLTTQVQTREGWLHHPLDAQLREAAEGNKLRSLPVQLLFNDPTLNLQASYTRFDRELGRPQCVGNGEQCKRLGDQGLETLPCPTPRFCPLALQGACKPYGRLYVSLGEDGDLGTFIFRTTGYNSIRTLMTRMNYYRAFSNNRLACLPLSLRLRGKSTTQSHRAPIYYVDLTLREGLNMKSALIEAMALEQQRLEQGYDQAALDEAARQGFAQGDFEESEEELPAILEEFYPEAANHQEEAQTAPIATDSLSDKLGARVAGLEKD